MTIEKFQRYEGESRRTLIDLSFLILRSISRGSYVFG